jgi:geranylgeranyl reductase family protein
MNCDYDVIVVGAGPGGSNAAAVALRGGLRVAQIDRFEFPRVKPCAGGVTIKACNALQLDLEPSIRQTSTSIEFNLWKSHLNRFSHQVPILRMVLRPEFDNFLVEQNRRFDNFTFMPGERVLGIEHDGCFKVKTEKRTISSRQLVGADGASSIVNRVFNISRPKASAVAIETNIYRDVAELATELRPCFDFGVVEWGYGWVFPKDDHWSLGIYTFAKGIRDLRERLKSYIAAKGFTLPNGTELSFEAHTIPVGGYRLNIPEAPVYLVGDAGGFADALTGEGIYAALESGRLAGQTICDVAKGKGCHSRYYRRLKKRVLADTFLTYHGSKVFYRNVGRSIGILENPLAWRSFVQGYSDGATFTRSLALGGFYLLKSLAGGRLKGERLEVGRQKRGN